MRLFSAGVALFVIGCLAATACCAEEDQFRVAAGLGIPYGRYGVNAEYRFNSYASVGAGLGYFQHDGLGWALGAMF